MFRQYRKIHLSFYRNWAPVENDLLLDRRFLKLQKNLKSIRKQIDSIDCDTDSKSLRKLSVEKYKTK